MAKPIYIEHTNPYLRTQAYGIEHIHTEEHEVGVIEYGYEASNASQALTKIEE
jgi:hypothetical protein